MSKCSIVLIVLGFSLIANAKLFRNAYVAFELPSNWQCALEQTEWVCRSENTNDSKEAIIILTAKETGPTDSFDLYQNYLNSPKTSTSKTGQLFTSQVLHSKNVQIEGQKWIDGWHLSSEIPNYYTRYLATIKDKIAILVTFSAHKLYYTKYSQDFFNAIKSLRVIASKGLLSRPAGDLKPGAETLGIPTGGPSGVEGGGMIPEEEDVGTKSGMGSNLLAVAILAIGIGGYLFLRRRKKG